MSPDDVHALREMVLAALLTTRQLAQLVAHAPDTWLALRHAEESLAAACRHLGEAKRHAEHHATRSQL